MSLKGLILHTSLTMLLKTLKAVKITILGLVLLKPDLNYSKSHVKVGKKLIAYIICLVNGTLDFISKNI